MEDSHIAEFDLGPDIHIFGVFDGHGGMFFFFFSMKKGAKLLYSLKSTLSVN